jgi:hypothetical protein
MRSKIAPPARNSLKFWDIEYQHLLIHQLYLGRSKQVNG